MTQSEATTNFMSSSFPYGGSSGLSLKREEEREKARRIRALQLQKPESDSPVPHFPQPRKVQAPNNDPLQSSVQAALGDYKIISESMHQKQYLLLGIGQVPQTPVEGTAQKSAFNFDGKQGDKKEHIANGLFSKLSNSIKSDKSRTHKPPNRTQGSHNDKAKSEQSKSDPKNPITHKQSPVHSKKPAVDQPKKSPTTRTSTHDSKSCEKSSASLSASSKDNSSSKESTTPIEPAVTKEAPPKEHNSNPLGDVKAVLSKLKEKRNKSKEEKESKPKPPKLSITKGNSMVATTENKPLCEDTNLDKILEEMTQPSISDPPLTGIQTPLKVDNRFAFPHLKVNQKHSPIRAHSVTKKKDDSDGLLDDDLKLSDDESDDEQGAHKPTRPRKSSTSSSGSSSDDSDSDSTDSDSDSSDDDKDDSPVNSPTKKEPPALSPATKLSNGQRAWGLGDLQKAFTTESTKQPPTTASGPELSSASLNTVGGEGLRGNQAAPAANMKSSLNTTIDTGFLDPLAHAEDNEPLFDALPELPDFSSSILDHELNGLDELSHDVLNDLLLPPELASDVNNVVNSNKLSIKSSPRPTEDEHVNNGLSMTFKLPKGNKKEHSSKKNSEMDHKTHKEKERKCTENEDKAKKAAARNKKAAECAKSRMAEKEVLNLITSSEKSNSEKVSSEKSSSEKSSSEKHSSEKHSSEKPSSEKHSSEKPSSEKHSSEKHSSEKHSSEKHSSEKHSSEKHSSEKHSPEKHSSEKHSFEKSGTKKKATGDKPSGEKKHRPKTKDPSNNSKVTLPMKPISDGESEEVDVVTVSYDRPPLQRTNSSSSDHEVLVSKKDSLKNSHSKHGNHNKTKVLTKLTNGVKELANGKLSSPLSSPYDDFTNGEITLDSHGKPDSLVVKIDLALLRRVPRLPGTDSVVIKLKNAGSPALDTNGSWECMSPARGKISKRHLSIELDGDMKKSKLEPKEPEPKSDVNDSKKKNKSHDRKDAISRTHPESRKSSNASTGCLDRDDNRRKRSPSRDNDRHSGKRRRHEDDHLKDKDLDHVNGWDRVDGNGHDLHNGVSEPSTKCSCSEKIKEVEAKRDACIERLYQPESRVPHGPDFYLQEAKRVKRSADVIKDYTARAHKYFEAVMNFVRCGRALEQNRDSESKSAYQMYMETIEMLKYAMRLSMNKTEKNPDKRFLAICMRLESLLYMRLFRLRKDGMVKGTKMIMEHFKAPPKCSQAPSPYNVNNTKLTGTPSPMSPTPSPSGSIGSIGSVGSTGSNEAMTTPSRTGKMPSSAMTSPVNATIPQRIHAMAGQHLISSNHMLFAFDVWEQSQGIFNEHKDFFMDLDRSSGPVTLHSSISHVIDYVDQGYKRLKDSQST